MSGDRQGGDGADWLLAQLAAGGGEPRPQHPVTPPSFGQPTASSGAAPVEPSPPFASSAPGSSRAPAPAPRRNEEVLDWFSLAEPPARDTGTRALPVVGEALPPAAPASAPPVGGSPWAGGVHPGAQPPAPQPPAPQYIAPQPPAPQYIAPPVASTPAHPQSLPVVPPVQSAAPAWNAAPAAALPPVWQAHAPAPAAEQQPWAPAPAQFPSAAQAPAWNQPAAPQAAWNQPAAPQPSPHAPLTVEPPVGRPELYQPSEAAPAAWERDHAAAPQTSAPIVPGPATPTAPFALTWGEPDSGAIDSEDALRAAFRLLSQPDAAAPAVPQAFAGPAAPADSAAPTSPATPTSPAPSAPAQAFDAVSDAASDESPFAGFAQPPVARSSFTPVTPAGASGDFGADLWSAMQEPEAPPAAPEAPELTRRERLALEQQQQLAAEAAAAASADVAHTRVIPVVNQASQPQYVQPQYQEPPQHQEPQYQEPQYRAPQADAAQVETPWYEAQQVSPEPTQPRDAPRTPFPAFAAAPAAPAPVAPAPAQPVDDLLAALGGSVAAATAAGAAASAAPAAAPEGGRFAAFAAETTPFETRNPVEPRNPFEALNEVESQSAADVPSRADAPDPFGAFGAQQVAEPQVADPWAVEPQVDAEPDGLTGLGLTFDDDPGRDQAVPQFGSARAWSAVPAESVAADEVGDDEEPVYQWGIRPDPTADDPHADAPMGSPLRSLAFGGATAAAFASAASVREPAAPVVDPADRYPDEQPAQPFDVDASDWFAEPAAEEPPAATAMLQVVPEQYEQATEALTNDPFASAPDGATQRLPIAPAEPWRDDRHAAAQDSDDDNPFASLFAPTGPVGVAAGVGAASGIGAAAGGFDAFDAASGSGAGGAGASGPARGYNGNSGSDSGSGAAGPMRGGAGGASGGGYPGGSGGSGSGGSSGSGKGGPGKGDSGGRGPAKPLIWVAGGLLVLVVLAGLFFLGSKLVGGDALASMSPSASESDTASDTPAPAPTAPQPMGVHAWNTLFGGECLDPFASAWEEEYTVVDCGVAHAAQLVYRGTLPGDEAAAFPGEAELGAQMNTLCTAAGIIDVAAAAGVPDLQVQGSYPVTEEQWAAGERTYYCFANRAGGEPLTGSIAGPGPTA
ncbi:hypothetical protein SAMN05428970_3753 [Agromyces sp. CF514]|uniref:hypothetical protein n=1 Tax=Agromyces sp. CF514 TaxID=1881031 RepID=UPI0008F41A92|nr:hypothetical protein [Agromyces sp. CF514]SFR91090.1 hypothetical protein SAMN05428970_3753 [Agromyces sp. CF514]